MESLPATCTPAAPRGALTSARGGGCWGAPLSFLSGSQEQGRSAALPAADIMSRARAWLRPPCGPRSSRAPLFCGDLREPQAPAVPPDMSAPPCALTACRSWQGPSPPGRVCLEHHVSALGRAAPSWAGAPRGLAHRPRPAACFPVKPGRHRTSCRRVCALQACVPGSLPPQTPASSCTRMASSPAQPPGSPLTPLGAPCQACVAPAPRPRRWGTGLLEAALRCLIQQPSWAPSMPFPPRR